MHMMLPEARLELRQLDNGVELATDPLPGRNTVAMHVRVLAGVSDEAPEWNGVAALTEDVLPKGTDRYSGRQLADAFDRLGIKWGGNTGRQSTLFRIVCLPEFTLEALDLVAELLVHPTFPEESVKVAVELAQQDLRSLEDDPDSILRMGLQRIAYGPVFGSWPGGTDESLRRIQRDHLVDYWRSFYCAGRLQIAAAGPVHIDALALSIEKLFRGFGSAARAGRDAANYEFTPARFHRPKELEQEYIGIALPGLPRGSEQFAAEQVLLGVLSGGMGARLFTEVREKHGLVYWVGAWHEQPRGKGMLHLGASTTPARCQQTYDTLLRELRRISEDLSEQEVARARDGIISQALTEDDLTRARAASLSDDLFHFGKPVGPGPKLQAIADVTTQQVRDYAAALPTEQVCLATVGTVAL